MKQAQKSGLGAGPTLQVLAFLAVLAGLAGLALG